MNEKHSQRSTAISTSNSRIQILAFDITPFDPQNTRIVMKKLFDFVGIDTMFDS